jgi:hypothetical protein
MPVSSDYIKSKIDAVREEIGRTVTFHTLKSDKCSDCVASGYYDPLTDTSWNFVCPICKGTGWSSSVDKTEVLARIHWAGDERIQMSPGGKYYVGDCQLTIDPSHHSLAQNAMKDSGKVIVDGRDMRIQSINPMGAPTINRIRLICKGMGLQSDQEG